MARGAQLAVNDAVNEEYIHVKLQAFPEKLRDH